MKPMRMLMTGAAGAAMMFFLDPVMGRRRRAMARDRVVSGVHRAERFGRAAGVDLGNRLSGLAARARQRRDDVRRRDDDVALAERVRSAFGRVVTHPGAVHLTVYQGVVDVDGAILPHELDPLVDTIRSVEGVATVNNRMLVTDHPEHVPGLQGSGTPPRHSVRRLLRAPGIQLASIAFVSAAAAGAMRRRRRSRDWRY